MSEIDPVVGNWYQLQDKGQSFVVVAVEDNNALIEIQHFGGDLEEIDLETWWQLDIEPTEAPENISGPLDIGELDDLGTSVTDTAAEDWMEPSYSFSASSEDDVDGEDKWGEAFPEEDSWESEGQLVF